MNIRVLKSYSKVWKIERVFYQVGGVDLPYPVALNTAIYYLGFVTIMYAIKKILPLNFLPGTITYVIIPGLLAWLSSKKLLDGKNPIFFLRSLVIHFYRVKFKGRLVRRFRYCSYNKGKAVFRSKISYRIYKKI